LRSQGINANEIRQRHLARTRAEERRRTGIQEEDEDEGEEEEGEEEEEEEVEEVELDELASAGESDVEEIIAAGRQKRRRRGEVDDDDTTLGNEGAKICVSCGSRFTVTVYTVEIKEGLLCRPCGRKRNSELRGKKQAQASARKKRKQLAKALLERTEVKVPTLQDQCVRLIVKFIDDVEILGDVGIENSLKLSRILSRSRKLNSSTMKLFLDPQQKALEFWDCSELDSNCLSLIPAVCPNLERLTLGMCGQLSNDNLMYFATNLPNLKSIYLDGPFLINKNTWITFLETAGPRLEELTIRSTHRVDSEILAHLVENCSNLVSLTLSRLSDLKDPAAIDILATLTKLEHLEISHPDQDLASSLVTDEGLINILNQVGSQLHTLILDGCLGLTDNLLVSGIAPCCGALSHLSLQSTDLTNEGIARLFENWSINSGLEKLNLERCIKLGDKALDAIVSHSGSTLVELNINSCQDVTKQSLNQMVDNMPNLTCVDLGFVRAVDDDLITCMSERMKYLRSISVYGVPRVTQACRIRNGLLLFGRQSDVN
jgi:DNA repair protein RAD7